MDSTNDEYALIESVRKIAELEIPKYQTEQHYGTVPRELFHILSKNGISGANVSDEYGGTALSPTVYSEIIRTLATVDLGVAVFTSVHGMVAGLIEKFGSAALKNQFLPTVANGTSLAAFALTEPSAGSDAAALKTTATAQGDHYILNGEKCYITSAGFADLYLVFAKTSPKKSKDGITAFLLPHDSAGITVSPVEKKMGAELSPIASMHFDKVSVPRENLLGQVDGGYKVALGGLAGGRLNIAAAAIGLAEAALAKALAYVQERKQFGKNIIEFQGVQFILADMQIKLDTARAHCRFSAQQLTNNPNAVSNRLHTSVTKCYATDCAMQICTDAVQLLGGAGYIREHGVECLMRDAKMLQIVEGTNQIQRAVIAREMMRHS